MALAHPLQRLAEALFKARLHLRFLEEVSLRRTIRSPRRVPHLELAPRNFRGGDNFKKGKCTKSRISISRLHTIAKAAVPSHSPTPITPRAPRPRMTVAVRVSDKLGTPSLAGARRRRRKGGHTRHLTLPDRMRRGWSVSLLRGEQHPHDLAAVLVMLENFLTD